MSVSHNVNPAPGCVAVGLRLMVGIPVLAGSMFLLGLIGWFVQGCPADLAPGRWPFEVIVPPFLALSGLLAMVMVVTALWVSGCAALVVGDAIIAALSRLRR